MLEFIIISGLATMGVNTACSLLVAKKSNLIIDNQNSGWYSEYAEIDCE